MRQRSSGVGQRVSVKPWHVFGGRGDYADPFFDDPYVDAAEGHVFGARHASEDDEDASDVSADAHGDDGVRRELLAPGDINPAELTTRQLGAYGEDATARQLESHGFEILERNWTCAKGEADIIAATGDTIVFVEVKTRLVGSSQQSVWPELAVDKRKRSRYEAIAECYLMGCGPGKKVRFDVVAVEVQPDGTTMMNTIEDAFGRER